MNIDLLIATKFRWAFNTFQFSKSNRFEVTFVEMSTMHHALEINSVLSCWNKLLKQMLGNVFFFVFWPCNSPFEAISLLLVSISNACSQRCISWVYVNSIHVISQCFWEVYGKESIQQEVANLLGEVFIFWSGKIPQIRLNGALNWKPAAWSCMGQGLPDSEGFSLNGKLLYLVLAWDWLIVYPRRKCSLSRWSKYFLAVHDHFSPSNNSGKFGMFI